MRLLLDANVSGRRIGRALAAKGHDVRAVDQDRKLEGASDPQLLDLAEADGRILVSFNVGDFAALGQERSAAGRSHPGMILLVRLAHREFGAVIDGVDHLLAERPSHARWRDHVEFLGRAR